MMQFWKRVLFSFLFASTFVLCLFSCKGFQVEDEVSNFEDTQYVKFLSDDNSVSLNGVKGKTILYVNFNDDTSDSIQTYNLRTLSSVYGFNSARAVSSDSDNPLEKNDSVVYDVDCDEEVNSDYKYSLRGYEEESEVVPNAARSTGTIYLDVQITDFTVNESKKMLYVDSDDAGNYRKVPATLRAIGYSTDDDNFKNNDTAVCLVWVLDEAYTEETSQYGVINSSVAQEIADKFAYVYNSEREIFGTEKNLYGCDTGKFVNIVVCDIDVNTTKGGVVGYFSTKDYCVKNSNLGKYFYIDSYYVNYDSTVTSGSKFVGTGHCSTLVYSTLVHEFQHMIYYKNKCTLRPIWFDEMLSMMAEDLLDEKIGIEDSDSGSVKKSRLPYFNHYYNRSGIDDWNTDAPIYSYSTAYAFGAFLTRNYGGVDLIKEIERNGLTGMNCIVKAIKTVTGKDITSAELYSEFIQSCTLRNDFAHENKLATLDVDGKSYDTSYNDITAKLNRIDIYGSEYSNKVSTYVSRNTYKTTVNYGPILYGEASVPTGYYDSNLRPHGFIVHYVGEATEDSVVLNFTRRKDSNEKIMVIIQDKFTNSSE